MPRWATKSPSQIVLHLFLHLPLRRIKHAVCGFHKACRHCASALGNLHLYILYMFAIVLVCLGNFQEYILTNIAQLIKLGHTNIYVITNNHLMQEFKLLSDMIYLISAETLNDTFNFAHKSTLNREFRNGFWHLASARLFVLHSFMVNYRINNVIHIENDVIIYYNCDETLTDVLHDKTQMYIPFDTS